MKTIRSLSQLVFAVGFLALLLASAVFGQEPVLHGRVVGVTIKVLVAERLAEGSHWSLSGIRTDAIEIRPGPGRDAIFSS